MELVTIEFERYEEAAKTLPIPNATYSLCTDDDAGGGRDIVLMYEIKEAA